MDSGLGNTYKSSALRHMNHPFALTYPWELFMTLSLTVNILIFSACGDGVGKFVPENCPNVELRDPVSLGTTSIMQPVDLLWTGDGFVAVWRATEGVFFTKIGTLGDVVIEPLLVQGTDSSSNLPSIGLTDDGYAVAFYRKEDTDDILHVVILDGQGNPLSERIQITDGSSSATDPKLAASGDELGIIWLDDRYSAPNAASINRELYFRALSYSGESIGEEVRITTSESITLDAELIYADGVFALTYQEKLVERVTHRHQAFLALFRPDGSLVRDIISLTDFEANLNEPSVAWSGENFAVAFSSGDDPGVFQIYNRLEVVLVDQSGTVLSRDAIIKAPEGVVGPDIEWTGEWFAVGTNVKDEELGKISILALDPQMRGISEILSEPLDIFSGIFAIAWADDSFGILYLSSVGEKLEVLFTIAVCTANIVG